jgi:hypothetical protein
LFYLKYDSVSETIYVSTLNYVYACALYQNKNCRIIAQDFQSARGLFLDSKNRFLYVVDHKKKVIKRLKLDNEGSMKQVTTVLSSDTMPIMGDIFYMTIFENSGHSKLVWSEFLGKIKMSNVNVSSNCKEIFSTNEYTYSINLMDNSSINYSSSSRSKKNISFINSLKDTLILLKNQIFVAIYFFSFLIGLSIINKIRVYVISVKLNEEEL